MSTKDTHDRRLLIFLAVLMSHLVIVLCAIRTARQVISSPENPEEPLVLMPLPGKARATADAVTRRRAAASRARTPKRGPAADNAITVPPEVPPQPKIDWEQEAELAARNGVAGAERERKYRDLAGLSPAQLSWIKQNHMEPAPPGIQWNHPRIEFTEFGLPFLWINDHCILITVMVFCKIGHIEANGEQFKHMRDPHDP